MYGSRGHTGGRLLTWTMSCLLQQLSLTATALTTQPVRGMSRACFIDLFFLWQQNKNIDILSVSSVCLSAMLSYSEVTDESASSRDAIRSGFISGGVEEEESNCSKFQGGKVKFSSVWDTHHFMHLKVKNAFFVRKFQRNEKLISWKGNTTPPPALRN